MPATPPATSAHTDIPAKSTDPVLLSGEGSVYRRGPGWEAAYHVDGRRRTFRAATSREARERLTEVLRKLERGETLRDERISVADYLEYWLAAIEPTIRPSTHKRYREYVRVHAIPEIGRIKMVQLSPMHLQGLYAKRLTAGSSPLDRPPSAPHTPPRASNGRAMGDRPPQRGFGSRRRSSSPS